MNLLPSLLSTLVILLANAPARAELPAVALGQPQYAGSGCPNGTARATLSPDLSTLSLIFDQYTVTLGEGGTGGARRHGRGNGHGNGHGNGVDRRDRRECDLILPLSVAPGYRMAILRVDYRGFNSLPHDAVTRFRSKFGLRTGSHTKSVDVMTQEFRGPLQSDFLVSQDARVPLWSDCGGPLDVTLSTALVVRTNRDREEALASIDSADLTAGANAVYQLQWQQCN